MNLNVLYNAHTVWLINKTSIRCEVGFDDLEWRTLINNPLSQQTRTMEQPCAHHGDRGFCGNQR